MGDKRKLYIVQKATMLICMLLSMHVVNGAINTHTIYMNGQKKHISCNWSGAPSDSILERIKIDYEVSHIWDGTPWHAYMTINSENEIELDSLFLYTARGDKMLHQKELLKYYGKYYDHSKIKATWMKDAKIEICEGRLLEVYIWGEEHYEHHEFVSVKDGVVVGVDSIVNNRQISTGIKLGTTPGDSLFKKIAENFPVQKYIDRENIRNVVVSLNDIVYTNGYITDCNMQLYMRGDGKLDDEELKHDIMEALGQVRFATYLIDGQVRTLHKYKPIIHLSRLFKWLNK